VGPDAWGPPLALLPHGRMTALEPSWAKVNSRTEMWENHRKILWRNIGQSQQKSKKKSENIGKLLKSHLDGCSNGDWMYFPTSLYGVLVFCCALPAVPSHTQVLTHNNRRGTYGTGLALVARVVPVGATAVCVAGVAFGSTDLDSVWHL